MNSAQAELFPRRGEGRNALWAGYPSVSRSRPFRTFRGCRKKRPQTSEGVLFCAALFAREHHAHFPLSGQDAVRCTAFSAFTLDTRLAPFNSEGVTFQCLFHQTFGFGAHRLL